MFHKRRSLPGHPNGMRLTAFGDGGSTNRRAESTTRSAVASWSTRPRPRRTRIVADDTELPHPFDSGASLLEQCRETGLCISTLMLRNETAWRPEAEVLDRLRAIWGAMQGSVDKGCRTEGILPGGLKVKRRAAALHRKLKARSDAPESLAAMDWGEPLRAGGQRGERGGAVGSSRRRPTARPGSSRRCSTTTSTTPRGRTRMGCSGCCSPRGRIGTIYKTRASISGAEMGCQGEVGVACSMAAAGLAELMGGTPGAGRGRRPRSGWSTTSG